MSQTDSTRFAELDRRVRALEDRSAPDERWRLVSEELPEETGPVLAWRHRNGPVRTWWYSKGYMRDAWRVDGRDVLPPTHWRPNVEPPVGEDEG